jgi:death-on-curing family protein
MKLKPITLDEIKYIAHSLAKKTMDWDEPIPEFNTRFPHKLESCLVTPFQTFDKKLLFHGLIEKSAILFYLIIKNHPFQNGNKRIAVTTLLVFLLINGYWLKMDAQTLYSRAVWVASSPPDAKNETVKYIEKFIRGSIIKQK